jgi:hypothetical protein
MRYDRKLALYPRVSGRPAHYEGLFIHAINDDPRTSGTFMPDWEITHTPRQRFVLGGAGWFLNNTGLNSTRLSEYRERGIERFHELAAKGAINWYAIPGMQGNPGRYWREMSRQQFNNTFNGSAVYLSKLMYVMMTCEVAVEDLLRRKHSLNNVPGPKINAPEDIYAVMSVIPVCWNVNKFNANSVEHMRSKDPQFLVKVARACGQREDEIFLNELATGSTVSFETALGVYDYCITPGNYVDLLGEVPRVRAAPGRYLGVGNAASGEKINCG